MLVQLLLFFCSAVNLSLASKKDRNVCSLELQSILAVSPSCAEKYFTDLDLKLRESTPLLFSSQASAVIENFENTFGVSVNSYSAFGIQCNVYSNTNSQTFSANATTGVTLFPLNNGNGPSGIITSVNVAIDLNTTNVNNLVLRLQSATPTAGIDLFYGAACAGNPGIQGIFQDGGLDATDYCADLNVPRTYAAIGGSIMQKFEVNGIKTNTPMFLALRVVSANPSNITFNSASLTICSTNSFSYNAAKSNLNFPGLRYDSGVYYYTSVYRDELGQMQYITISGSNIHC
jgi:hypothetical protein